MQETDVKRRIDTARDILVGKVPDPKGQIEQITIALIYKFMDDMDAESEELGGKRTFFAGDFARYGWPKLMRSGLSGNEVLNLYAEGISKMPENPGIPPLFRDIFKNAFLPYRDPETLRAFLKVIDEVDYDHSERLGDAFEYLLSILGSQGDAGQFRTPRHIIDFMVEVVDPKKNETILDPACGTAGFLISSYKHILSANTDTDGNNTMTPDEKGCLATNFKGYDISPDMVRLSLVNMYLHGFVDPHIYEYDTLTSLDRWNEYVDVILANPPFMSPKGGIRPHERFSVKSNRSEVLFVDYMAEHLTANGRAGIIVPEGIIFQSGVAYRKLREMLIRDSLVGVISIPSGVFQPYTGVKTSILILDKRFAKTTKHIMFSSVQAIGMSLGIKRTPTDQNDLPHVLQDYDAFYAGHELSPHSWLVDRDDILANDCNLSGDRYRLAIPKGEIKSVKLGSVCSIKKGVSSSTKTQTGPYPLIVTAENWLTSSDYQFEGDSVCVPLISSTGHGRASIKRIHYVSGKFALANLLAAVQPLDEKELNTKFLSYMLNAEKDKIALLMNGAANVSMKVEDLAEFSIPLPPIEVQREIVAEIEGYQKVIDGARAVLDNYRPHIPIHPDWTLVELGEVCSFMTGGTPTSTVKDYYENGTIPWLVSGDIHKGEIYTCDGCITRKGAENSNAKFLPKDSVLIALNGQGKTRGTVALLRIENATCNQSLVSIKSKDNTRLLSEFIYFHMKSMYQEIRDMTGDNQRSGLNIPTIKTIKIPIPPLETQQAIVTEIEAEQALVASNLELIERFEKKIQATLARVWGE